MDHDTVLKVRVSSELKEAFERACRELGQPASAVVRSVMEEWLRQNGRLDPGDVEVTLFKPDDYQPGAWQVSIGLKDSGKGNYAGSPIPFQLPELPRRRLASDQGYQAVVLSDGSPYLGGQFVNGVWRGHLYSNGCAESENPTPLNIVREALRKQVHDTLRRFE